MPPGHDVGVVYFPRLAKKLDELSHGRIKLTVYPAGALVPVAETVNMLGKGVYEMAFTVGAYWIGLIPVAGLEFGIPGSWYSEEEMMVLFFDKGIQELLRDAYGEHGIRYLSVWPATGDPYHLESKVNFKNLDGLRKLKVRSTGVTTLLLDKLGVKSVPVAYPEVYMALKLGTIDATTQGLRAWWTAKLPEVTKYMMWPPLFIPSGNTLMNLKVWNELPPDMKQAVEYAVLDSVFYSHRQMKTEFGKTYDDMKKDYGVEFVTLPPEDQAKMAKAAQELWTEMAKKDKYSAKFMAIVETYMKHMGHIK